MSLTKVVPYFRTVMTTLGHKEWKDALDDTNIPSTVLDRSFHIMVGDSTPIKQNQDLIEINQAMSISLFVKGYRDTATGRDQALTYQEAIIRKALEDARRATTYDGVKNVKYAGGNISELSDTNNNVMRLTMNFNCFVIMAS